ncbi:MAG: hypothetical protein WKF60_04140 [Ilumatobacter sp.]
MSDSVGGYVSGPAAATEPRRLALERVASASGIVLVEGVTDQIAVETLAAAAGGIWSASESWWLRWEAPTRSGPFCR